MGAFAVQEKRAIALRMIASGEWRAAQWTAVSQIVQNESLGLLPDGRLVSRQCPKRPVKQILSLGEAAAVAGVHPVTIRRWVKSGRLATADPGPALFIRRDDLERVLHTRTRGS